MRLPELHINTFFPVVSTLKGYSGSRFRFDLIAGATVAVMLIPQGMAYALIAGLPPEYGLYASLVPMIIYAMMGTSNHLAVGPVALIALLVASAVGPIAGSPEEYIALSILLALMAGGIQLIFGLMKLGFLVNLMSHPVLSGFISAAAIVIGLSQLHHLLGVDSVSGASYEVLVGVAQQAGDIHIWTAVTGVTAIGVILLIKKRIPAIPGPVVAVIAGVLIAWLLGFEEIGVAIVGSIPAGLPQFAIPEINTEIIMTLFPMAMAIALVAYMEAIAVAKAIQQKDGTYKVDPDQELVALGSSNILGSLFQSFPVTGSFSRTAVTYETGGKTTLSSFYGALLIGFTLLFLTPLLYHLPNAILAAIIMVAVAGLVEVGQFKKLWKLKHYDRYMFLATFAGTLLIGIEEGILLGVTLSVIMLVYRSARPHHSVLGRVPYTTIYRDVLRYQTEQEQGHLIFRFDAPVHFANAEYFRERIDDLLKNHPETECLIIDLNGVNDIDSTGLDVLFELKEDLAEKSIDLKLAEVKGPVRDLIRKGSGSETWNFFMDIESAMQTDLSREKSDRVWIDD